MSSPTVKSDKSTFISPHFRDQWNQDSSPNKHDEKKARTALTARIVEASKLCINAFDLDSLRNIIGEDITKQFRAFISPDMNWDDEPYIVINGERWTPPLMTDSIVYTGLEVDDTDIDKVLKIADQLEVDYPEIAEKLKIAYELKIAEKLKIANELELADPEKAKQLKIARELEIAKEAERNDVKLKAFLKNFLITLDSFCVDKTSANIDDEIEALFYDIPDFDKEKNIFIEKLTKYKLKYESIRRIIYEAYPDRSLDQYFVRTVVSNSETIKKIISSEAIKPESQINIHEIAYAICKLVKLSISAELYQRVPLITVLRMMSVGALSTAINLFREQLLPDFFLERSEFRIVPDSIRQVHYELKFDGSDYEVSQKKMYKIIDKTDKIGSLAIQWRYKVRDDICKADFSIKKISFKKTTDNLTMTKVLDGMFENIKRQAEAASKHSSKFDLFKRKLSLNSLVPRHKTKDNNRKLKEKHSV